MSSKNKRKCNEKLILYDSCIQYLTRAQEHPSISSYYTTLLLLKREMIYRTGSDDIFFETILWFQYFPLQRPCIYVTILKTGRSVAQTISIGCVDCRFIHITYGRQQIAHFSRGTEFFPAHFFFAFLFWYSFLVFLVSFLSISSLYKMNENENWH